MLTTGGGRIWQDETKDSTMWSEDRYNAFMARQAIDDEDLLRLESYTATIEPVDGSKREMLHQLAMTVFWPHRGRDIDLFLRLGQGYVACDEIGRPLGSAMYFPMGPDFAMLGMMVVSPRLQSQGAGRRMLRRIMRDCAGRDLRITSTRHGFRLYESAGFVPVSTIYQQQGIVREISAPAPTDGMLRDLTLADRDAIVALDRSATHADRSAVFDALLEVSDGLVLEQDGEVKGFAMKRAFGKGTVIGPVLADSDEMAIQLTAPLLQSCEGRFARFDRQVESEAMGAFLAAAGLGVYDTVTEMRLGSNRLSQEGLRVYGLASHSLG
ncbi:Acetyltransferase (GNAT) domain-containing protein [Salipiger profundus]|nr:Acetyltransferase (GNAT) domain-containing protein [Salipiger profundus]